MLRVGRHESHPPMSLVAVYRLDEVGNVTRNGSVGGEDALPVTAGTTGNAIGLLGNGLTAVGAAATVSKTGGLVAAIAGLRSFTVSYWVKYTAAPGAGSASVSLRSTSNEFLFLLTIPSLTSSFTANIYSNVADAAEAAVNPNVTPNSQGGTGIWHHVAVSWDNAAHTFAFYINGALRFTSPMTVAVNPALTGDVTFSLDWTRLFISARTNMIIDQVMLDNTAVDLATVQAWYNSGAGYDPTAPVSSVNGNKRMLLKGCR
jgi:hypothetical protein